MWQRDFTPVATAIVLTFLVIAVTVSPAGAYAEEPLPFRDPYTNLTLRRALYYVVHHWNFDEPEARRAYANQLAAEIVAMRAGQARNQRFENDKEVR